jgi:hypothetical protein
MSLAYYSNATVEYVVAGYITDSTNNEVYASIINIEVISGAA